MLDPLLKHAENLDRYTELHSHANLHTRLVMRKGVLIDTHTRRSAGSPRGAIEAVRSDSHRGPATATIPSRPSSPRRRPMPG